MERAWASKDAQLVLLIGRRRVGKSALLRRLVSGRPIVYYAAARQLKRDQLSDLGRAMGRVASGFRPGRPPRLAFDDWDDALDLLAEAAERKRVGLVIDEFPYLMDADPAVPSLIQRWWDRFGEDRNVMLVLSGSHQSMMRSLVAYDGALHGRPTATMHLPAMDYLQAAKFVPRWSAEDRIRAFAVSGGIPAYLRLFDDRQSLVDELLRLAFDPNGRLFTEAPNLIQQEFVQPKTYESILRAIARGESQPSRIAQHAGLSGANVVGPYIDRLIGLGLVDRQTPPSEAGEIRPRISRYVIADHYLRFYFRFVDEYRSEIQLERGRSVLGHIWPDEFDHFVSRAFEEIACRYVFLDRRLGMPPLTSVGPWWFAAGDIDVAAMSGNKLVAAGEVRWSNTYLKPADLAELQANITRVAPGARPSLLLFSRSGFDPNLRSIADVRLIRPRDLYDRHLDPESPRRAGNP